MRHQKHDEENCNIYWVCKKMKKAMKIKEGKAPSPCPDIAFRQAADSFRYPTETHFIKSARPSLHRCKHLRGTV